MRVGRIAGRQFVRKRCQRAVAAEEGVELIAPTMGKPKSKEEKPILDDFTVGEASGEITLCPGGEAPCEIRRGKDEGLKIYFDPAACEDCDHRDYCAVGLNDEPKIEYTPEAVEIGSTAGGG